METIRKTFSFRRVWWQEAFITLKDKVEELGMEVVENPEWIYLILDAEKHILFGIRRKDGSVDWGAGIPGPVKKEIDILKGKVEALESMCLKKSDKYE